MGADRYAAEANENGQTEAVVPTPTTTAPTPGPVPQPTPPETADMAAKPEEPRQPPLLEKYVTAHQLAKQLLAGPDLLVFVPMHQFDSPGEMSAHPTKVEQIKVEGRECVAILPV